jgi:hypothetical protein
VRVYRPGQFAARVINQLDTPRMQGRPGYLLCDDFDSAFNLLAIVLFNISTKKVVIRPTSDDKCDPVVPNRMRRKLLSQAYLFEYVCGGNWRQRLPKVERFQGNRPHGNHTPFRCGFPRGSHGFRRGFRLLAKAGAHEILSLILDGGDELPL